MTTEETTSHSTVDLSSGDRFRTLVVVEFAPKAPTAAIEWIISKIQSPRYLGGGSLLVKTVLDNNNKETILHIGAKVDQLLIAAELMELKKPYKDGTLREIQMGDLDEFENTEDLDNFLTLSEKQRIVKHELDCIRALESDQHIPGLPKVKLYKGIAILPTCQKEDVISQVFPLHDKRELKAMGHTWYKSFFSIQPIGRIHRYFGETVAMYFSFLGFYTMALIPPALIGAISEISRRNYGLDLDLIIFFSVFNLVWATIFLEAWKRHCSTLAYNWGTIKTERYEEARPEYYGELSRNKITDRLEPKYPKWKRVLKYYCVSLPVVLSCLFLAFLVMLVYFWLEDIAIGYHKRAQGTLSSLNLFMPTVVYAVVISIMNAIYRKVAKALNDWENHRLQSAYENHLIVKLVLFDFTNCFLSLFYVAFYMQDFKLLRSHLGALLITQQILGQVQESLLPYLMFKRRKHIITKHQHGATSTAQDTDGQGGLVEVGDVSQEVKNQAEVESSKDEYTGTLDDYLEMFLQFGYVFLFSSVFPTAAFWALLNNVTEIRTDAFKMCRTFQRPFSQPTAGIGAWQVAFEIMSVVAVMTNCALIALTPQGQKYASDYGEVNYLLFFVLAEHAILFVKLVLSYVIPDEPQWVETATARLEYHSKLAWRAQRSQEAKQHLNKRSSSAVRLDTLTAKDSAKEL